MQALMIFWAIFGPSAWAYPGSSMPEVSSGSDPHRTFGGVMTAPGDMELLTVPEGQEFIVTAFVSSVSGGGGWSGGAGFQLSLCDGMSILAGQMIGANSFSAFGQNAGNLKIDSGRTLCLNYDGSSTDASYYIQGRLVAEGSPYRSASGTLSESDMSPGPAPIFVADADRVFIVRTLGIYCAGAPPNVVIDGAVAVPRLARASDISASRTLLATGRGSLAIPAGSTLGLQGSITDNCEYYMDGAYSLP